MKIYVFGWREGKTTAFVRGHSGSGRRMTQSQMPREALGHNGQTAELGAVVTDVLERMNYAQAVSSELGSTK